MKKVKKPLIKWNISTIHSPSYSPNPEQPEFTAELIGVLSEYDETRKTHDIYMELDTLIRPEKHPVYPVKVIYSGPATVILWSDGDKTVSRCGDQDFFDEEKGFVMAYLKKYLSNKGLKKMLERWVWDKMDSCADFTVVG